MLEVAEDNETVRLLALDDTGLKESMATMQPGDFPLHP